MSKTSKTRIPPSSDVSLRVYMPGRFAPRAVKKPLTKEQQQALEDQYKDAIERGVVRKYDHAGRCIG